MMVGFDHNFVQTKDNVFSVVINRKGEIVDIILGFRNVLIMLCFLTSVHMA